MKRPDPNRPLLMSARFNDDLAERKGTEQAVAELGLDLDEVVYVAEQRALRLTLHANGRSDELQSLHWPSAGKATDRDRRRFSNMPAVRLDRAEQEQFQWFVSCSLDGICLGWGAHRIAEDNDA